MNTKNPDLVSALGRCFDTAANGFHHTNHTPRGLLIGFSGGLDSTVLLVLAKQFCTRTETPLRALYIDHQLHADSHHWQAHCERFCRSRDIAFQSQQVALGGASAANLEEAARDARYAVFAQHLRSGEWLLTAHHADDQAETLLLQLLRGAGVQGLASMPVWREFANGVHARPLLSFSRHELTEYAQAVQLEWIEDPSNVDQRFDRNLMRSQIMPLLQQRWPAAVQSICRSASHCASAARLMVDVAQSDLAGFADRETLPLARLRQLDPGHLANLLRRWIQARGHRLPGTVQLEQIERSLVASGDDSIGDVQWADAQMRRYGDTLYLAARGALDDAPPFDHRWVDHHEPLYVPELQHTLTPDSLPAATLAGAVHVHSRRGGERFFVTGNSPHRKQLKKWFQEQRIPPWQRNRVIVFSQAGQVIGIHGPV